MVTPNVESLSTAFDSIVQERDVVSAGALGLAGAGGGVVATQLSGRLLPRLGFSAQPTQLTGLLASGTVKMAVGALLGFGAIQLGGTAGTVLAVTALGALILGGGDWINGILSSSAGVPAGRPATARMTTGNGAAASVSSAQPVSPSQDPNQVGFRQTQNGQAAASGGSGSFR